MIGMNTGLAVGAILGCIVDYIYSGVLLSLIFILVFGLGGSFVGTYSGILLYKIISYIEIRIRSHNKEVRHREWREVINVEKW